MQNFHDKALAWFLVPSVDFVNDSKTNLQFLKLKVPSRNKNIFFESILTSVFEKKR